MNTGERVGDYEIVDVLGAGGMGQVYKVRNTLSERIEAMKVVLPNMSSDPELAQRFLREIKVQAALDHPNIARLHTAQQFGDQLFMVMEFVDGNSLEKLLEKGPLALSDSLGYISQVLDALAYAHARTVVHRDIKPANIMITPAGVVKLMDFGIARMQTDRRLTRTGHTVGSLFYMSPEQIQGGEPDPRSDLYALGVTLYEMVTGQKPFQGDSDYSIMAAHLQQTPVAPLQLVSDLPPDLSEIILMAIAKDPGGRFQSAEAFRAALRNINVPAWKPTERTATVVLPSMSAPTAPAPAPAPAAGSPMMASAVAAVPPLAAPAAGPAPMPPPAPYAPSPAAASGAPKPTSRRGLYMALGSVATLLVLAAAIIEVPKFINARAQQSAPIPSEPKVETPPAPVPLAPPSAPAAAPAPAPSDTAPAAASGGTGVAAQPAPPSPTPATPAENMKPSSPGKAAPASHRLAQPVAGHSGAPLQTPPPAASTPPVQPPPPSAPSTPPATASAPPPAARPSAAELNSLRQNYNLLSIRVSSAKAGLRSLQQQMASQGLGMRGDMLETETRMDYQMKEAMDYIRSGDADQARSSMEMARRALEAVEKFLGR